MAQQFNPQNLKKRTSVLVFIKGSAAPLVLYTDSPEEVYAQLQQDMKNQTTVKLIEKETNGPLKKVCFLSNQIAAVAMQEEQYM